jgi:hypothetical protein
MEITIADIKKFLEESKDSDETKAFIAEIAKPAEVTPDLLKKFAESDDGKIVLEPMIDKRVTEAVKTRDKFWEKERLEPEVKKRVAAEVVKLNPAKDPMEIKFEELQRTLAEEKAERAKDQLKRQIVEKAQALGVDAFFLEDYLPATPEQGELYLKRIADRDKKIAEKAANDLMASGKFVPNGAKPQESKIDYSKLTLEEAIKLENEGKLDN